MKAAMRGRAQQTGITRGYAEQGLMGRSSPRPRMQQAFSLVRAFFAHILHERSSEVHVSGERIVPHGIGTARSSL